MKDFSNYRPSTKDNLIWSSIKIFAQQLEDNGEDILVDGVITKGIITTHTNPLNEDKIDRKLKCSEEENIKLGSTIDFDNSKWLVITKPKSNKVFKLCKIFECTNVFKWQDSNLDIQSYPCIIQDKTSVYSDGLETGRFITLADDQILITIQNNQDTKKIKLGKRIMFNSDRDNIYKVTKIQDLVTNGLIYITMTRTEFSEANDREDLSICDYVDVVYELTILNGNSASIDISQELQLNVQITKNGNIVDQIPLLFISSDPDIAEVLNTGVVTPKTTGSVIITARMQNSPDIFDTISVDVVSVPQNNFTVDFVNLATSISLNQSKTYTVEFKNNGITVEDISWFNLTADDNVSSTDLATIVSTAQTTCTIKANNNNRYGYVRLHVRNLADTASNYVRIQVKSLF